jgi:hypothetical protein
LLFGTAFWGNAEEKPIDYSDRHGQPQKTGKI